MIMFCFIYWLGSCFGILERRIIGGKESSIMPWAAYLKSYTGMCGGVLYTRSLVITAAHCITHDEEMWKAYVNVSKVYPQIEGGFRLDVLKKINHENYDSKIIGYFDISVWWINGKTSDFTEVKLDAGIELFDKSTEVKILGWGNKKKGLSFLGKFYLERILLSDKLNTASLSLISDTDCEKAFPLKFPSTSNFCIGPGRKKSIPSDGDSGGPVYRIKGNEIILIGIISFGPLYQTKNSYEVCVKISEPSVASFINHFVPFFNPSNVKNGKIAIDIPSHHYARKFYSHLPYKYSNIGNDLSAFQVEKSRTSAFLKRNL